MTGVLDVRQFKDGDVLIRIFDGYELIDSIDLDREMALELFAKLLNTLDIGDGNEVGK